MFDLVGGLVRRSCPAALSEASCIFFARLVGCLADLPRSFAPGFFEHLFLVETHVLALSSALGNGRGDEHPGAAAAAPMPMPMVVTKTGHISGNYILKLPGKDRLK